jgi:hypothetical protein
VFRILFYLKIYIPLYLIYKFYLFWWELLTGVKPTIRLTSMLLKDRIGLTSDLFRQKNVPFHLKIINVIFILSTNKKSQFNSILI